MQRFFYLGILAVGLVSCSNSTKNTEVASVDQGARMMEIDKDGNNNPFAFKKSDVEQGDSGLITGGKR
ncbi:MAG: hypothetical protein ABGZ08_12220, partial [Akkermansiaceae bacterium]